MNLFPNLSTVAISVNEPTEASERGLTRFRQAAQSLPNGDAVLAALNDSNAHALLSHIFNYSPFLSRLLLLQPQLFTQWCTEGSESLLATLSQELKDSRFVAPVETMQKLRQAKNNVSLLIALADISGLWPMEKVTRAVSDFAILSVQTALDMLLRQAEIKGELTLKDKNNPSRDCGLFVLAMGKMGAGELNYSSDIDLIVLFDREKAETLGIENPQHYFPKLTRELACVLQERTADGYVFRVDLRLRPDPSSTPMALSTAGAITYYETVGQNWERAALIKACPVAGDIEAGNQFLRQISPFIWRKHLDFAAIADIQSIKRQMDARNANEIRLAGHNVKTGLGGIREIEFFAQIHQLIWGGRLPQIRLKGTCRTLEELAKADIIPQALATQLISSYQLFRTIEHRLQMVDDQQTHTLPESPDALARIAIFSGYATVAAMEEDLLPHFHRVHNLFSTSFCGQGSLGDEEGTLSFTGVESDPATVETIRKMGFSNAQSISEVIQAWHRGARRATRTKRARELITELTPALLKALAATPHPEQAFTNFDTFLAKLPAGIQLFSLFQMNPHLLHHIAVIMGAAPAMAESLSKNPSLLDTILTADFFESFPLEAEMSSELNALLAHARDFQDEMDITRRFKNEKQFQAGVQILHKKVSTEQARRYLSEIADVCVLALLRRIEQDFQEKEPELPTACLAVIALGRWGARELTFGSDLDMVFVYETEALATTPMEEESLLYNKVSKRLITAVSSLTPQGKLYEVDTRLRPSGKDGALAVSLSAFDQYFNTAAWTFELMALTRARIITGSDALQSRVEAVLLHHIQREKNPQRIAADILDIRAKVDKEFGTDNAWNLKYVRGGLMDLDFLAQYYVLCHAHKTPDIIHPSSGDVFTALRRHGLLNDELADTLISAHIFLSSLFSLLRLCGGSALDEVTAVPGLKAMIASSMQMPHFGEVRLKLHHTLEQVKSAFNATLLK